MDLQEVARLQVDVIADVFADQWDRVGYDPPRLVVEAAQLFFGQRLAPAEGVYLRCE